MTHQESFLKNKLKKKRIIELTSFCSSMKTEIAEICKGNTVLPGHIREFRHLGVYKIIIKNCDYEGHDSLKLLLTPSVKHPPLYDATSLLSGREKNYL